VRIDRHPGRFRIVGEQLPAERAHDRASGDLDHGNRQSEQAQDERAEQQRAQQQGERVDRDASRQRAARRVIATGCHLQEDRRVPRGIDDG
jgi:hypothetical protein